MSARYCEFCFLSGERACRCLPISTDKDATMNDNLTPPCVIRFDQIRKGDTIECTNTLAGIETRRTFTVLTRDGQMLYADDDGERGQDLWRPHVGTVRLLDRPAPPKPPLPMEGYIEAWGKPPFSTDEIHLVIAMLDGDGDWYGLTEDGNSDFLTPNQITRWNAVRVVPVDPTAPETAPKAADGLRERVEALAGQWESDKALKLGLGEWERGFDDAATKVISQLRTALTETSADA